MLSTWGAVEFVFVLAVLAVIASPFFWALVEWWKRGQQQPQRALWLVLILFVPFTGSLIYLLVGRAQRSQTG